MSRFVWVLVLALAILAGGLGKKTLDVRKERKKKTFLVQAIARAKENGGEKFMDKALRGKDVPKDERAATKAAYHEVRDRGEV